MFLSLASLALAQTPAEFWQKPLKEGVEPAKATVVLVITAPETGTATSVIVRDSTNLPEQLGKFEPDGILTVEADKSTKANVLAALAELRKYGRGVVIIDGPWVGGDFEDPVLLTVDAKADDRKTGIRARDLLAQLDGGQEWVAVIAPTFAPGMTPSGESYIGLDADQWASFAPSTMNGYFLTSHADVGTPPSATCNVRFTHVLGNSVNAHYGSGHDLTFDELTKLAKREAGLTPACGFAPEARYTGNLAPPRVMLVGSGILPEPDAPVAVMMPEKGPVEPVKIRPKHTVPLPVSIGTTGLGAVLLGTAGVLAVGMQADAETARASYAERFSETNAREEFGSEAEAQAEAEAEAKRLDSEFGQRGTLIGALAIGGGVMLVGGGVTFVISDQGGMATLTLPF